jgi:DNA-binding response OmpR family regulator
MNLLIVEDDSGVSEMLQRTLRKLPLQIDMVSTWTEMAFYLKRKSYEVLLLDLGLPDSPTDLTLSRIRDIKMNNPGMTVCVITGHPSQTKENAMKAGADDFVYKGDLMKPFWLIQIISNLISRMGSSSKKLTDQIKLAQDATDHVIKEMNQ